MGRALVTDLYELTMAASQMRHGIAGPATFSLFVGGWRHAEASSLLRALRTPSSTSRASGSTMTTVEWLRANGFDDETVQQLLGEARREIEMSAAPR